MEAWAQSCASDEPVAVAASEPMWALQCEFPTVTWALMGLPPGDAFIIPERGWRASAANLDHWDRAVLELSDQPRWLVVQAEDDGATLSQTARQILTRYQRLVPRTNAASSGAVFQRVLSGHRALHDLSVASVRADHDHALDVWQWILRLSPGASLALQLAALFHDVARLLPVADRRDEPRESDAASFEGAHAGVDLAVRVLEGCGIDTQTSSEVASLIFQHAVSRGAAHSPDAVLLADADALSFFSLDSPGFADCHGREQTWKKVRHTLGRMSSSAVRRLTDVRLREDVHFHLAEAARMEADATLQLMSA
jgi:uncharacterized protein DUF4202